MEDASPNSVSLSLDDLPSELCSNILTFLDLPSLKSIRLTSTHWSHLSAPHLIPPTFHSFPYRDDLSRLLSISLHPIYRTKIHTLHINLSEANEYCVRHNVYFLNYLLDPPHRMDLQNSATASYAHFNTLTRKHKDKITDLPSLIPIFSKLENLDTIHITQQENPFPPRAHDQLHEVWKIPSTRAFFNMASNKRFTNILTAITSLPSPQKITSLSHDRLYLGFFLPDWDVPLSDLDLCTSIFQNLKTLKLGLDTGLGFDHTLTEAHIHLAQCIQSSSPNLQELDLSFNGKKTNLTPLLQHLTPVPFSHLTRLSLGSFTTTQNSLCTFLLSSPLKPLVYLKLGGKGMIGPRDKPTGGIYLEGTFMGLFKEILMELDLTEGFWIEGDFEQRDEDMRFWEWEGFKFDGGKWFVEEVDLRGVDLRGMEGGFGMGGGE